MHRYTESYEVQHLNIFDEWSPVRNFYASYKADQPASNEDWDKAATLATQLAFEEAKAGMVARIAINTVTQSSIITPGEYGR